MRASITCLLIGTALALSACKTVDVNEGARPGARVNDDRAPDARLNLDTVVILDKSLQDRKAGKLAIESSGARRSATGTLEVYAVIRNRTDYPLQIEARTQFFDRDKVPVEGPTAWQRVHLDPQAVSAYRELSTRVQDIAHYYVEIREGR
jgi:hypothetical protein